MVLPVPVPVHHRARPHVAEQPAVQARFVHIQFQYASHVPQPRADLGIPETEGHALSGDDLQPGNHQYLFQVPQGVLRRVQPRAVFPFHRIAAFHAQRIAAVLPGRRNPLNVVHDPVPFPPVPQENLKERIDILHIALQDAVVHPALPHGPARHQETVLHREGDPAGEPVHGFRVLDAVKPVLRPAVGHHRDLRFRAGQPRREQHRVRPAGDVHHRLRVFPQHRPEYRQHRPGVIDVHFPEGQRHPEPPVTEVILQLFLRMLRRPLRADIDHLLRAEDLHPQHVFQRALVQQFDQRFRVHPYSSFPVFSRSSSFFFARFPRILLIHRSVKKSPISARISIRISIQVMPPRVFLWHILPRIRIPAKPSPLYFRSLSVRRAGRRFFRVADNCYILYCHPPFLCVSTYVNKILRNAGPKKAARRKEIIP